MGISDRARNALRAVLGVERDERDKAESPSGDAIRNAPASTYAIWGRDDIGGLLSVSQTLMGRFADYEAMNDYPDIRCFSGEMKVYLADEGSLITPLPISKLAVEGEGRSILAFDREKQMIVKVPAQQPRISGRNAAVLKVALSNNEVLRVTPNHKILTVAKGYVEAKDLRKGDFLVGARAGFITDSKSVLTTNSAGGLWVMEDPVADGVETVFDVTTSTHNLIVNGVVCHNSAFHFFANDATQPNMDNGRVVWVTSQDDAIRDTANVLLRKKLRLEDELFSIAYTLCQYGNDFEEVLVTDNGVVGLNHLPPPTMRRIEQLNGSLIGYIQDITGRFTADPEQLRRVLASSTELPPHVATFEDWQSIHFRLRSTARRSPYGVSVAEGARWIWKRLVMLEDAVMIYKLTRSPARYAFYVDVTDVPANRVEGFLKRAKRDLKKRKMVSPNNNFLDMRYNPLANDEDYVIAVRDGRDLSRVEVLSGPDYQNVDDVMYFLRKLHGALMVPRAYLGQDEPLQGKAILSNEDIRAARVTLQVQRELKNGIERLIRIDQAARGVQNPWQTEFEVMMTVPSNIYELASLEVKNARVDFAARIAPYASRRWLSETVFKFSDDEIKAINRERKKEAEEASEMGMDPSFGAFTGGKPPTPEEQMEMQQQMAMQQQQMGQELEGAPPQPQGPAELDTGMEPTPPPKRAPQIAWAVYDQKRRLEERRYQESRKNQSQLLERMEQLQENDKVFAARMRETQEFLKDFRAAALRNVNGSVVATPAARPRNRVSSAFEG